MYERSGSEQLVPIDPALPEADAGAPMPSVLMDATETAISYWTPTSGRKRAPVAVVRFHIVLAAYLGSPNDEALDGHPLYEAGLTFYEFVEVKSSPWVADLGRRNRVHPSHDPERFAAFRHFILPFHDETFECVAKGVSGELTSACSPTVALQDLMKSAAKLR